MINLIGISGEARAGKDTVTGIILDYLCDMRIPAYQYALAGQVKEQVCEVFGWGYEESHGHLKETVLDTEIALYNVHTVIEECLEHRSMVYDAEALTMIFIEILWNNGLIVSENIKEGTVVVRASPRKLFQLWGTDFARKRVRDTVWMDLASEVIAKNPRAIMVVSDVRFHNEADWVRGQDSSLLLSVNRPDNKDGIGASHESEKDIKDVAKKSDKVIVNDGSLDDLREAVLLFCSDNLKMDS